MNDKRAPIFFLLLLVASLLLLVFVDLPGSPIGPNHIGKQRDVLATVLIVAQITAPLIALLGLVTTTYFAWRKDRREQRLQEIKQQIEDC